MTGKIYNFILVVFMLTITACGDSGGDRADGIEPGPPPSGGNPVTPPNPQPDDGVIHVDDIQASDTISLSITQLEQTESTSIVFELLVNGTQRVTDLSPLAGTFTLANLVNNEGSSRGMSWQSYIERTEDPICRSQEDIDNSNNQCTTFTLETDPGAIDDSARKIQDIDAIGKVVTTQADGESEGTLTDNEDGTWRYTYATRITTPADNDLVHRACLQFRLNTPAANPCVDYVPSITVNAGDGITGTSLADGFYDEHQARKIVNQQSCNTCHANLTMHGARTETDFCVTCHNPGTTDANSGNSVDFKQLIHKIHFGRSLPSKVDDGKNYKIWGFRNSEHDYSNTSYPQEIINCSRCHAGEEDIEFSTIQGVPTPKAITTLNGHNWVSMPTKMACESCHEKLFTDNVKLNGNTPSTNHTDFNDEKDCAGCHRDRGSEEPGSIQANQAHRNFANESGQALSLNIISVTQTMAGESPKVVFSVLNLNSEKVNLLDPTQMCAQAKFDLRMPSDAAKDYRGRIGLSGSIADLVDEGNNEFSIQVTDMVAADVDTIAAMIDFNYPSDCDDASSDKVRLDAVIAYQSSSAAQTTPRREIVNVARCNNCHERFLTLDQYHGGTRGVNNPEACIACHGSEFATSDRTREFGALMHGIHGSAIRETPHKDWTTEKLQFPGDISVCSNCHEGTSYTLPLPITREPIKVTSSLYSSAQGTVCSSCHDSSVAKAHMSTAGGAIFDTTFAQAEVAIETCSVCHGRDKIADVSVVHNR